MTDNLLQKLEEKVMHLLAELENLRKELTQLKQEHSTLKTEKINYTKKMQGLIALLDTLELVDNSINASELEPIKGREEYATA